jgi:peptidoglycan/xylan/chitin deacetylase (PgdA/CDA1 family)
MEPDMRRLFSLSTFAGLSLSLALGACATSPEDAEDGHTHGDMTEADISAAFEQAFREKDDDKADSTGCSGVRVPDRGPFAKRVALTFDDGPNPATTPEVMATLRRHQVPATFFVNGSRVKGETEKAILADMVADQSFIVANHTWSHVNMAEQGSTEVARQIDRTAEVISAAGGENRYFRFPFGSSTCATAEAVRSRGLVITGWHVDSADWCFAAGGGVCRPATFRYVPDAYRNDMKAYVMSQVRASEGGVLLFHDIHRSTADALEGIIEALKAEGYTFTNVDDLNTFPKLNGSSAPPPPSTFVGDACKSDAECGFQVWNTTGRCHAAGFCTIGCEGYCPDQAGKPGTFCVQDPLATAPAGVCVPQAVSQNGHCADLPGTLDASAERYVGTSNAPAKTAEVCMPQAPGATTDGTL